MSRRATDHDADAGDGRNVDVRLGELAGEAADQVVPARRSGAEGAVPFEVWPGPTGVPSPARDTPTYYDRPVIKEPVWIWSVPAYMYVGGAGGTASVLGAIASLSGRSELRRLVRRCNHLGTLAGITGTALLIHDLGRPSRFLHMLRVFRPSSPMSVGSWVLAAYAPAAALATIVGAPRDPEARWLRAAGGAAEAGAGVLGPPLAAYTGVLLANTAVPVWQATRRTLPPLFEASGVTSAASLLDLLDQTPAEERVVHRFGVAGKVAELALAEALQREADAVEEVGRPLHEGPSGALWRAAKALVGVSLVLSLVPRRWRSRRTRAAAGVTGTAGSIALRFAVFHAGKASARSPRATFHQQRSGHGAAEVSGR